MPIRVSGARQLLRNHYETGPNPREPRGVGRRRMLIGQTDGGRVLTLVIESTPDPNSWAIVTGWTASPREREIRLVSDQDLARRVGPEQARRLGVAYALEPAGSPKPAKP